jgi:hypothetical protein
MFISNRGALVRVTEVDATHRATTSLFQALWTRRLWKKWTQPWETQWPPLDMVCLPHLDCTRTLQDWVQVSLRLYLLAASQSLKPFHIKSLPPKQEPGFLKLPVPLPLAVLIYTKKLAPSLHFFCVYTAIIYSFQLIPQQPLTLLHWLRKVSWTPTAAT